MKLAFPAVTIGRPGNEFVRIHHPGMTLRDWFAGQALAGWVSDPGVGAADAAQRQNLAEICYAIADAMLEARKP